MNKLKSVLAVLAVAALAYTATAQDTNSLKTQIGQLEARTSIVIIKGSTLMGSIPIDGGQLAVRCKQTVDTGTGETSYGLAIEIENNGFPHERTLVDDTEVEGLLGAVDYLMKINSDATPLTGFEATFSTKAGLRVIADSVRKDGGILTYLQIEDYPRVSLTSVQMTQLYNLIAQCQKSLDKLKATK